MSLPYAYLMLTFRLAGFFPETRRLAARRYRRRGASCSSGFGKRRAAEILVGCNLPQTDVWHGELHGLPMADWLAAVDRIVAAAARDRRKLTHQRARASRNRRLAGRRRPR